MVIWTRNNEKRNSTRQQRISEEMKWNWNENNFDYSFSDEWRGEEKIIIFLIYLVAAVSSNDIFYSMEITKRRNSCKI
jgi:hypothetical protein